MAERKPKSDATTATSDRRSATRYRTRALTDGSIVGNAEPKGVCFLGTTVNVSSGGVLLRTYEALAAGQALALTMHLPEGDLVVEGTVLHVEQDPVGCRLAGVRFTALGDVQSKLLARHLKTFEHCGGPASKSPPVPAEDRKAVAAAPAAPVATAPAVKTSTEHSPLRKSTKDVRQRTSVVFPVEGEVRR